MYIGAVHCVIMLGKLLRKITRRDPQLSGRDVPEPSPPTLAPTIPNTAPQPQEHLLTHSTMAKRRQAAQGARDTARYAAGLVRKHLTKSQTPLSHLAPSSTPASSYKTTIMDDLEDLRLALSAFSAFSRDLYERWLISWHLQLP